MLCGNPLPWVTRCLHLGNTISTETNIRSQDIKTKRAAFIDRNNTLIQEFQFAHPVTRVELNQIYNCHLTGSQLWDINSPEIVKFEKTWNVSVQRMYELPRETHRYLIEPISGKVHLRSLLARRFVGITKKVEASKKIALRGIYRIVSSDASTVTGKNLRMIMLNLGIFRMKDIKTSDVTLTYVPIPKGCEFRPPFVKELIDIRQGDLEVKGFEEAELHEVFKYLCTI